MQEELRAADWCHPSGANIVHSYICEAKDHACEGDIGEVSRLLRLARDKLDLEWGFHCENCATAHVDPGERLRAHA